MNKQRVIFFNKAVHEIAQVVESQDLGQTFGEDLYNEAEEGEAWKSVMLETIQELVVEQIRKLASTRLERK